MSCNPIGFALQSHLSLYTHALQWLIRVNARVDGGLVGLCVAPCRLHLLNVRLLVHLYNLKWLYVSEKVQLDLMVVKRFYFKY